jgi:AraC-like DNA-binding protein
MTYRERPSVVPGAILWERTVEHRPERTRILPDGCIDLIWDGRRLLVAGPDTTARWHESLGATSYVALRLAGGLGPAWLGVPADELRDQTADLEALWPSRPARDLAEQVSADPAPAMEAWAAQRAADGQVDPLGPRVLRMATAGMSVAAMARQLGMSPRQLHRRCLPTFGYGPRRLVRVLRMGRALGAALAGAPLAQVAADCSYADQAHLSREFSSLAGTTPAVLVRELALR